MSSQYINLDHLICLLLSIEIECPELNLGNGMVTYTTDMIADFEFGTVATHSCDAGFVLQGSTTRTCVDDDGMDTVGVWNESPPTCIRKFDV